MWCSCAKVVTVCAKRLKAERCTVDVKYNENEHRKLKMKMEKGQLAVFIIVGPAALLT